MIDQHEVIWGIMVPPLLMAVGMIALGLRFIPPRFLSLGTWFALVYAICHLGFKNWPAFAVNVHDWPAWLALMAGGLTWCGRCTTGPFWLRTTTRAILIGVAVWLMLRPQLNSMPSNDAWLCAIAFALPWLVVVLLWERAYQALSPGSTTIGLAFISLLSSVSLLLFNTLMHAQLAGIVTAAIAAVAVLTWWRPTWMSDRSLVSVAALVLPSLWILGVRYADLPWWGAVVLGLAGLAPWIGAMSGFAQRPTWQRIMLQVVAMLVISAPIIGWGVVTTMRAMAEPEYGY